MISDETVTAKIYLTLLRSISDSSLFSIIVWSGQLFQSLSQTGPSYQFCPGLLISQPLLPKCVRFCFAGTYFQFKKTFSFILATQLQTNTLYSPLSFNQCKITVSDHAYTSPILNLLRLHFKLPVKFEDMCAVISSSRGINIFFLANRDSLVIRLWLFLCGW